MGSGRILSLAGFHGKQAVQGVAGAQGEQARGWQRAGEEGREGKRGVGREMSAGPVDFFYFFWKDM
jgi:hypothetical protein